MTPPLIFVQIAAYRDPELVPTLRDCVAQAARPDRLRFGIAWQHDGGETLAEFAADPRCRVLDIDYRESQGVCWARNRLQDLYDGEPYTLALDSHHRFEPGWDDMLERQLAMIPSAKPVLTGYLPRYFPDNREPRDPTPRYLGINPKNLHAGEAFPVVTFRPRKMPNYATLAAPLPARFLSGHFTFAHGAFIESCRHDPALYFRGEEISLSVRAFTHGYDLYHPHRTSIYHYYRRLGMPTHWSDHPADTTNGGAQLRDVVSQWRVRALLGMKVAGQPIDFGRYGLGNVRSLAQYEAWAGIDFATGSVSPDALIGMPVAAFAA